MSIRRTCSQLFKKSTITPPPLSKNKNKKFYPAIKIKGQSLYSIVMLQYTLKVQCHLIQFLQQRVVDNDQLQDKYLNCLFALSLSLKVGLIVYVIT